MNIFWGNLTDVVVKTKNTAAHQGTHLRGRIGTVTVKE